jgi:N-formylglutamate amidohydrolase
MVNLDKYITYIRGEMPLILSVPHGGTLLCREIPKRSHGILGIDKNTIKLAQELINQIEEHFHKRGLKVKRPSYIFCNVSRSKIDLNRPIERAFNQKSELAKQIYNYYHKTIRETIDYNIKTNNQSLLMDIHGFEINSRPDGYRDVDIILGTNNLKSLYPTSIKKKDWNKNIRGKIVQKFIELKVPIAPGHERRREYVLSGGYTTKKYGASSISNSQSMQIEFSDRIRVYDRNLKEKVLNSLAGIIFNEFNPSRLKYQ